MPRPFRIRLVSSIATLVDGAHQRPNWTAMDHDSRWRVWAPHARSLELELAGKRHPMARVEDGFWRADLSVDDRAATYAFCIDGGGALPDPRSAWQPEGVHGPSRVVDHGAFPWSDAGFTQRPLSAGLIYELHVGTFTNEGTFDAAIERLDALVELGVTHVELMPVVEFPGRWGWGYDGVDLFAPHHLYGGPDGLKRLVDACHRRNLAVILDVVYNHLGPSGNYLERFGPYFTDRYATPWGKAINLDAGGSPEVRRFFLDNARMWFADYHVDGLRLDAVHAIFDQSALHFLEELATEVAALEGHLGRKLVLIAESDLNDARLVRTRDAGGLGLDAQWSDDLHHALHALFTGERAGYYGDFGAFTHLDRALREVFVYTGQYSAYRKHAHGRSAAGLSGARFLGYLQTHDQVGNRAKGERIGQLVGLGRVCIGAAIVFTSPFVPMLFQGEEWAASTPFQYFTDHDDPELARAVSQGRRREFSEFGWGPEEVPDPQDEATFRRSKLDWSERLREPHAEVLDWYRRLIAYRRAMPELGDGRYERVCNRFDEQQGWFVMTRGRVSVAFNLSSERRTVPIPAGASKLALVSDSSTRLADSCAELAPDSVAIVQRDLV